MEKNYNNNNRIIVGSLFWKLPNDGVPLQKLLHSEINIISIIIQSNASVF